MTATIGMKASMWRRCAHAALVALACTAATSAQAIAIDAKALARFDVGYVDCETRYPEMRGQRDAAWLSLWRVRADERTRAQLAQARQSGDYTAERKRVLKAKAAGQAPAASSPVEQQCQALRAQTQRIAKPGA